MATAVILHDERLRREFPSKDGVEPGGARGEGFDALAVHRRDSVKVCARFAGGLAWR
jgi:hypothetical protein